MSHGHDTDCICPTCIIADMDRHLAETGVTIAWGPAEQIRQTAQRTRYAKPGQSTGNGIVRYVSEKQIRFIKRLMSERDTTNLVRLPGSEDIEHMSLRGARDLIDRLLACPERPKYVRPATPNQISFIKSLCERKGMADLSGDVDTFDKASSTIDMLKALNDAPRPTAAVKAELRVGIYRHDDGRIVLVKPSKQGRLYGKLYNADAKGFEYAPGLLSGLTDAHRMTVEECEALSVEMGACCMCGRELTATVNGVGPSQRYIGPICEGKIRG